MKVINSDKIKSYQPNNTLMKLNNTWNISQIISKIWHMENSVSNGN